MPEGSGFAQAAHARALQAQRQLDLFAHDGLHTMQPNNNVRRMLATIGGIIGAVVAMILMVILLRTVWPAARRSGSRLVLEYAKPRGLGIAMLLLTTAASVAAGLTDFSLEADAYLLKLTREEGFSGAGLVATNGNVVFAKGYGLANREHGIANTTNTIFRLGSVTKQFTAMCILILQEEHKLNVTNLISHVIRLPNERVYIVVLSNFDWANSTAIAEKLSALLFNTEQ